MFRKIGDLTMIGDEVWQIVGLAAGLCSMKSGGVREPLRAEFALATPGGAQKRPYLAMDRLNNKTVPPEGVFAQRNTVRLITREGDRLGCRGRTQ
jgi:hypothetical protein